MKHIDIWRIWEKVVTFTNKRNRNQVIKATKNSDGRITEIDPTGVRFVFQ
jgi:hypothetical protein